MTLNQTHPHENFLRMPLLAPMSVSTGVMRVSGKPVRVAGTRICGRVRELALLCVQVELVAGRARVEKFFVR